MQPLNSIPNNLPKLRCFLTYYCQKIQFHNHSSNLNDIKSLSLLELNQLQIAKILKDECKHLQKLQLYQPINNPQIFDILSDIPTLTDTKIEINQKPLPISTLQKLSNFRKFHSDFLKNSVDEMVEYLPKLESLAVPSKISQDKILLLKKLKYLKQLRIGMCLVNAASTLGLQQTQVLVSTLPHLTSLSLPHCELSDEHLKIISEGIIHIQSLDIGFNNITVKGLQFLQKHSKSLKSLEIRFNPFIKSDGVLFVISKLVNLQELSFSANQICNEVLVNIPKKLNFLQKFQMVGINSQLSLQCIEEFVINSPNIKNLFIGTIAIVLDQNKWADKSTSNLFQSLCQIETIDIRNGLVNDKQLCYLAKLETLKNITLKQWTTGCWGMMKLLRNTFDCNVISMQNKFVAKKTKRNMMNLQLSRHRIVKSE